MLLFAEDARESTFPGTQLCLELLGTGNPGRVCGTF